MLCFAVPSHPSQPSEHWAKCCDAQFHAIICRQAALGVGKGWLRTVRDGVPFVTVPCLLLDPSAMPRSTQAYPAWVCSLTLTDSGSTSLYSLISYMSCVTYCLGHHAST